MINFLQRLHYLEQYYISSETSQQFAFADLPFGLWRWGGRGQYLGAEKT
jgi:hypothetical protein